MRHFFAVLTACAALCACAQAQPPAPALPAMQDAEPDVTRQVSEILAALGRGTFARDQLSANAQAALPVSDMQAMMAALKPCGPAPALELLQRTTKGEERQYVYRAPCGGKARVVEINFGKGASINRLALRPD